MKVCELCRPDVITISKQEGIKKAAQLMKDKCVGSLVVVDKQQTPVGMLTDRDIIIKLIAEGKAPEQTMVADIMSKELLCLTENQDISDAIDALCEKGVRRAPVIDENKQLCGVITLDDLMACIIDELDGVVDIIRSQSKDFDIGDMPSTKMSQQAQIEETVVVERPIYGHNYVEADAVTEEETLLI